MVLTGLSRPKENEKCLTMNCNVCVHAKVYTCHAFCYSRCVGPTLGFTTSATRAYYVFKVSGVSINIDSTPASIVYLCVKINVEFLSFVKVMLSSEC